ncbi:MAG: hypothetical protein CL920_02020 [Deltaproteobacteria bacterium]|nr:hypothetical protein [Deltaproteobacteria bacterium]|tara:strand:- start:154 stop:1470 length:1317 start_codon:yes stop_codon:yes gene_type:complete
MLKSWYRYFRPEYKNPEERRKMNMLIGASFLVGFWGPVFMFVLFLLGYKKSSYIALLAGLGMFSTPFVLRQTGSLGLSANLALSVYFVAVSLLIGLLGGISSPMLIPMITLPVVAWTFAPRQHRILWFFATIGVYIFYSVGHLLGYTFSPPLPRSTHLLLQTSLLIAITTLGLSILWFHDGLRLRLYQQLESKHQDLLYARNAAIHANEVKSAFLANISHELHTPLNIIIGYSELLIEDVEEQPDQLHDLQKIHGAGHNMLLLVKNLLDFSQIETEQIELKNENVLLTPFFKELEEALTPLICKHQNTLSFKQEILHPICTDKLRLRQILFHLLSNACKFTENGAIHLHSYVETTPTDDWMVFEVHDTGTGIKSEQLEQIFRSFTQVQPNSGKHSGAGVGLSIVQQLCEMMGGNIRAISNYGEGSSFTVRLPHQQATE